MIREALTEHPDEVPEELASQANADPKRFRDFVVRYAKVEVL